MMELAEGALCPISHIINEVVEHYSGACLDPQDTLPVSDWPPDGLGAAGLPFEPGSSARSQSSHGLSSCPVQSSMLCLSFNEDVVKSCMHSYRRTGVFNSS